jgi:hypothetical protein
MERPAASFPGEEDRRILLPYFTMRKMFPNAREHLLVVIAQEGRLAQAMDEVRSVLRIERRVPHDAPDSFALSTPEQMLEDFRRIMAVTAIVMVVLSSIGLLVGGIGVMNIMLVSVTERTREIGVRKAVGARRADIILQFLTEAVVLTALGGVAGYVAGLGDLAGGRMGVPQPADLGAAVGGRLGRHRLRRGGSVLRHLAGGQSGPPGSGRSLALRVKAAGGAAGGALRQAEPRRSAKRGRYSHPFTGRRPVLGPRRTGA